MLISTAMDVLFKKVQELGKQKYWFLFLVLLFVVVMLINGIAIVPEESYQRLAQNPFITRTDIHFNNYWQETLLLPLIAYYLGLTGIIKFNALVFATILGAYSLFGWLAHRRWGFTLGLILSALLITSPLTTMLLSWLGTPDGLTVLLTVPFLFTQSSGLIFLLAFLGATNHPAFIITILEILILRWIVRDGINIKHFISAAIGVALGYASVKLFLYANSIDVVSRFDFMQLKNMGDWVRMNIENLPITLFSLFNIHWLILLVCLVMFLKKDKLFYTAILMTLLLNYGLTFFTLDTTRVFSLLSWGILFECIFHSYKISKVEFNNNPNIQKQFLQALILIGMASFISPRYFSWAGEIHTTPFYQLIQEIFQL